MASGPTITHRNGLAIAPGWTGRAQSTSHEGRCKWAPPFLCAHMASRQISISILVLSQISVLSVWFSSAAVLAEMRAEAGLSTADLAWLTTAVQLGFALGALGFAALGLADRFDPRRVFCLSALVAALANLGQLWVPICAVAQEQDRERCITQTHRVCENHVEYRLAVFAALADDGQDLATRLFALQPCLQFTELAHVLDGDDRLRRKSFDQFDMAFIKAANVSVIDRDSSNRLVTAGQRDA